MATKIIKMKDAKKVIPIGLGRPLQNGKIFFDLWAVRVLQQTLLTFKLQGARSGMPRWVTPQATTVASFRKDGSFIFRKRPGTDGSTTRRWSAQSKVLQASGLFRNSFQNLGTTKRKAKVGSLLKIADKIIRKPSSPFHRPVIFTTPRDIKLYKKWFTDFADSEIKF